MGLTYDAAGVNANEVEGGLATLSKWIVDTFAFHAAKPLLPLGYFANVLPLSSEIGLAISTDGVGTKILIAQELEKYDTIGIDCVAMNANDILCVGARPVSLVDYVAVERADPRLLGEIAKGLHAGARAAGINIPGGEIAQVREMVHGSRDGFGFDLVGTCVGTVHPQRLIVGQDVAAGDRVVGLASTGIHSNGLTLARRALFEQGKLRARDRVADLGRSVGEELLEPTAIYVRSVLRMMDAGLHLKACAHVTGDGFLNLARIAGPFGFVIDDLPEPPPLFALIQKLGRVERAEMFRVFNMGIGFCLVVPAAEVDAVREIAREDGHRSTTIGYAVADEGRRIWIAPEGLISKEKKFAPTDAPPPSAPS